MLFLKNLMSPSKTNSNKRSRFHFHHDNSNRHNKSVVRQRRTWIIILFIIVCTGWWFLRDRDNNKYNNNENKLKIINNNNNEVLLSSPAKIVEEHKNSKLDNIKKSSSKKQQKESHPTHRKEQQQQNNKKKEQKQLRKNNDYSQFPEFSNEYHREFLLLHITNDQDINKINPGNNQTIVKILLRPDLSESSVSYVKDLVSTGHCERCHWYRAEKPGILQGIIENSGLQQPIVMKGECPDGYENVKNDCPQWDSSCGCHGPVMTRGAVGWAAGDTGPDFFIDNYVRPAIWWGTQHTIWGHIIDDSSLSYIQTITTTLPVSKESGLAMLNDHIHFTLSIEKE